jgi:hypothetical protein
MVEYVDLGDLVVAVTNWRFLSSERALRWSGREPRLGSFAMGGSSGAKRDFGTRTPLWKPWSYEGRQAAGYWAGDVAGAFEAGARGLAHSRL